MALDGACRREEPFRYRVARVAHGDDPQDLLLARRRDGIGKLARIGGTQVCRPRTARMDGCSATYSCCRHESSRPAVPRTRRFAICGDTMTTGTSSNLRSSRPMNANGAAAALSAQTKAGQGACDPEEASRASAPGKGARATSWCSRISARAARSARPTSATQRAPGGARGHTG